MGAEMLSPRGRSPFAIFQGVDPELLRCEGRVRYLLVHGARDGSTVAAVGAIWVSEDGRRGGVVPNPDSSWAAAELVRKPRRGPRTRLVTRADLRLLARRPRSAVGLEIDAPEVAETLLALTARVDAA